MAFKLKRSSFKYGARYDTDVQGNKTGSKGTTIRNPMRAARKAAMALAPKGTSGRQWKKVRKAARKKARLIQLKEEQRARRDQAGE